jgi:hypothetical protein
MGGIEEPLRKPNPAAQFPHELDQFVIGIGHWGTADRLPVDEVEPDGLLPGGMNVDRVVAFEMGLQPTPGGGAPTQIDTGAEAASRTRVGGFIQRTSRERRPNPVNGGQRR